ncbi:hypothetical protein ISF_03187 [Cordyceps fumosorosea ARSEF 2679]|uniref:Uncharacterized protein n=1 Tax=Cordyceps fumosorosea (strain ARSEF 2679) TaxID=1081104 RepID=A0A162JGX2_CORFA|nr:hypothetical protein ISF_03187 [Cordyceps fumosorosea ARSEF 2679]OAA68812.1 hypothetical protein ISF_03187 [Cordyceps fumosorosea ARSEF 2679]
MASLSQQKPAPALSRSDSTRSKNRGRAIVKPILKKLSSHSNSDRGSFDFDPGWDDQPSPLTRPSADYDNLFPDAAAACDASAPSIPHVDASRPRDVSFSTSPSVEYPTWRSKNRYSSHMRSTSGTSSHASSIATSVSARNGTFVHPCQQTPRTATPSLSYANSFASLDTSGPGPRDCASTITEHDDDLISPTDSRPRATSLTRSTTSPPLQPYALGPLLRGTSIDEPRDARDSRPYLVLADGTRASRLMPTARSNSGPTAVFKSEFATQESPTAPLLMASSGTPTSASPLSPLRNSLDLSGFRLRSRSDVDTRTHQEQVRDARRKFQDREKMKDEKYAQKQLRRRDRANSRDRAKIRKNTIGSTSTASDEKPDFATTGAYHNLSAGKTPVTADEVHFQRPKRRKTAKHKTNGAWTAFMLWFRTRLLRLGRH